MEVEVDEQVVMTKIMIQVNTTIRVTIVASGSGRWEMDGKYCRSYRNECQRRMTFGNLERVPPTSTLVPMLHFCEGKNEGTLFPWRDEWI